MAKFIFTYRSPNGYTPGDDEAMAAWQAWFADLGDHVTNIGNPVSQHTSLGHVSEGTQLGGFSLITAADLQEATVLAKGCPLVGRGGGVEVGELADVPS